MHNRQLDDRHMERFEDEVNLLAEERGITFSAALALKTGEASPPAKKRTAKKRGISRADLEEIREGIRELEEMSTRTLEMTCGREFQRMLDEGEVDRRAKERSIPYQDAFAELQDEAYRPTVEATQERREAKLRAAKRTFEVDEEALDRRARSYADKHGVGYEVALEAVLPGSTVPVDLATSGTSKVDDADAELSRKAEARARREGCSYTVALEAVLDEGR